MKATTSPSCSARMRSFTRLASTSMAPKARPPGNCSGRCGAHLVVEREELVACAQGVHQLDEVEAVLALEHPALDQRAEEYPRSPAGCRARGAPRPGANAPPAGAAAPLALSRFSRSRYQWLPYAMPTAAAMEAASRNHAACRLRRPSALKTDLHAAPRSRMTRSTKRGSIVAGSRSPWRPSERKRGARVERALDHVGVIAGDPAHGLGQGLRALEGAAIIIGADDAPWPRAAPRRSLPPANGGFVWDSFDGVTARSAAPFTEVTVGVPREAQGDERRKRLRVVGRLPRYLREPHVGMRREHLRQRRQELGQRREVP